MAGEAACGLLALFDFDNTVANDNSDTFVVERAGEELRDLMRKKHASGQQWTSLMADMMVALHAAGNAAFLALWCRSHRVGWPMVFGCCRVQIVARQRRWLREIFAAACKSVRVAELGEGGVPDRWGC